MKKILIIFVLLVITLSVSASAQSTAVQTIMGFLSTSCPGSAHTCFKQYDSTNPMPVSVTIAP